MRRYRDRVYTFAHYTLRQREDAEDVTQEVLIRLWRNHRKLDEAGVLAWLLKVTRNACFDSLRRKKARTSRVEPVGDERLLTDASCPRPSPQATAEASDFRTHLEEALRTLSPTYREIVILREIDGLKYDEIVAVTGRSLSTVKVYLHRGRKQLREALRQRAHAKRDRAPATAAAATRGADGLSPTDSSTPFRRQKHLATAPQTDKSRDQVAGPVTPPPLKPEVAHA
ncbi:MAG: RNA polymerase sigma factor [Acidobacteriota bacterium]